MKKIILSVFVIFAASVFSNTFAQTPPAGGSDSDLRDNNIRLRSSELERVKREGENPDATTPSPVNSEIDTKYPQIKEDFEGIQMSQAAIIKAYSGVENVDYKQIETSAEGINKNAKRLDSNLFSAKLEKKEDKSKEKKTKTVRDLIIELDNAIGEFVGSAMFQNLRVVDAEAAKKTQLDLANIKEISDELSKMAGKMK